MRSRSDNRACIFNIFGFQRRKGSGDKRGNDVYACSDKFDYHDDIFLYRFIRFKKNGCDWKHGWGDNVSDCFDNFAF